MPVQKLLLFLVILFQVQMAIAQCGPYISTFPYSEDFETDAAWASGGTDNDWAWGTPAHPLINTAASGTKAWCVGGLAGTFYNYGQQSWLESPCFDFSALQYPWITFELFWECEQQYDGLGFQYSLDQGSTWTNVGSTASPTNCLQQNWFNADYINSLDLASPKQGWSGRVGPTVGNCTGGNGSGEWLTASHCLTDLAGEPSVKFRFIFGAGTTCNDYDGIAIDDIQIGDAPPNDAGFTFLCQGNTIDFTSTSSLCPSGLLWNFGDPASTNNSANGTAVSHTYPGPGTYQVTLTASGPCNAPSTVIVPVTIVDVQLATMDPGCAGNDGSISAAISGTASTPDLEWDPPVGTGAALAGLSAGTYTLTVSGNGICTAQASATLVQQNSALVVQIEHQDISCAGDADGSATAIASGSAPLNITWSTGENAPSISGLNAGNYSVTVIDAAGCEGSASVTIDEPPPFTLSTPGIISICGGSSVDLEVLPTGGTGPFDLVYDPAGPVVAPDSTTPYTVDGTDANGCTASADVLVEVGGPVQPEFTISQLEGCSPHCVTLTALGNGNFDWDLGDGSFATGATVEHCYDAGEFQVELTVTDDVGCSSSAASDSLIVVHGTPDASFIADPPVTTIEHPDVQLVQLTAGISDWIWTINGEEMDQQDFSPLITFPSVDCSTIGLSVFTALGCSDQEEVDICIEDSFHVFAPNSFTPNNDGINDEMFVITSVRDPEYFELRIHDRWGAAIHVSNDPFTGWNGEGMPDGVYIWMLRMRDTLGAIQERSGHVTLFR